MRRTPYRYKPLFHVDTPSTNPKKKSVKRKRRMKEECTMNQPKKRSRGETKRVRSCSRECKEFIDELMSYMSEEDKEKFQVEPSKNVQKVGKGSYGECFCVGDQFVFKKVLLKPKNTIWMHRLLNEVISLKHFARNNRKEENIVELKGLVRPSKRNGFDKVYMVFERMDFDLRTRIRKKFSESEKKAIMFNLLSGLKKIHASKLIHRDIKPANILVSKNLEELRICDFGLVESQREWACESYVCSRWYRAIELLKCKKRSTFEYNSSIDIWSAACIFGELYTHIPLFAGRTLTDSLKRIEEYFTSGADTFFDGKIDDPKALDLIKKMLAVDPNERITASQALKHGYFDEIKEVLEGNENVTVCELPNYRKCKEDPTRLLLSIIMDEKGKFNKFKKLLC